MNIEQDGFRNHRIDFADLIAPFTHAYFIYNLYIVRMRAQGIKFALQ